MNRPTSIRDTRNCTLRSMAYKGRVMSLRAELCLNPSVNAVTAKDLLLVERYSRMDVSFPFRVVHTKGERNLLEADIDFLSCPELAARDGVWDLYVRVKDGQAERRLRLAGNHSTLERLYFYNQNRDYLVVPYTTNRGNVSFRSREAGVIAKLEDAHMDEEGILLLQGYAFYPGWQIRHPDDLTKSVIFRSEDGSYEKKVEAGQMERREGNEDKERERQEGHGDPARFEIRVNLKDEALLPDHADTLQLHIELAYRGQTLESPPLEYTYKDDGLFLSAVVKTAQGKRKAVLKDRKNREVAFSVSGHTVFSRVKEQWLKLKDSRKMNKVYRYVFKAMEWLPADRNLIVFESFLGKQYSCNPRAIYEYLKEHHPHYKMYWSVDRTHTRPFQERNIPYAKRFSLKWLFLMARAGYWVTNSRMPLWLPKPKRTVYLQTWHGTPLKRLAADIDQVHMPGTNTRKYKRNFYRESRNWDYLVSPNGYSSVIFWRAFQYDNPIIESGYPRNDYLYHHNTQRDVDALKEKCGIPRDKKVILYAPTWRDDQFYRKGRYKFDLALDLRLMREQLGDDYIVILRMHYLVAEHLQLEGLGHFAYDFSDYEDIRDLYLISDLLITDYSSVFFDYANLRRPIIFYVYDMDRYRDKLRGFYFDIENNAPGPLVKTTEGVVEAVKDFEKRGFAVPESFHHFYNRFCYLECGESSHRVVEQVFRESRPLRQPVHVKEG